MQACRGTKTVENRSEPVRIGTAATVAVGHRCGGSWCCVLREQWESRRCDADGSDLNSRHRGPPVVSCACKLMGVAIRVTNIAIAVKRVVGLMVGTPVHFKMKILRRTCRADSAVNLSEDQGN